MFAAGKREAIERLDEVGNADGCPLTPMPDFMVYFHFNENGVLEFEEFGEDTPDVLFETAYPIMSGELLNAPRSNLIVTSAGTIPHIAIRSPAGGRFPTSLPAGSPYNRGLHLSRWQKLAVRWCRSRGTANSCLRRLAEGKVKSPAPVPPCRTQESDASGLRSTFKIPKKMLAPKWLTWQAASVYKAKP